MGDADCTNDRYGSASVGRLLHQLERRVARTPQSSPSKSVSSQPSRAPRIERIDFGPRQLRHIHLDRVPDADLDVGEMAISSRQRGELCLIKLELRRRIDGINPVFLVDRLTQH